MNFDLSLKTRCHVNKNDNGDRFVGIKVDTNNATVFFPMGYCLSDKETDIREDILKLLEILFIFNDRREGSLTREDFTEKQSVNFPVNAYMNIIHSFLEHSDYYKERERRKKISDRGKIDFSASLRKNVRFFQEDGSPFFDKYTVKWSSLNENNLITQIHKYCVFEAFNTLGWLFTRYIPDNPHILLDSQLFLTTLRKKLGVTFNDKDKLLFKSMIQMLEYLDSKNDTKHYYGTDRFEYVWEKLIDETFGIRGKEEFFPRTKWNLKFSTNKDNHALEPDSIMMCDGKIYVLDAKYYRYGITGEPKHLPESSSINKQITYGEYIDNCKKIKNKYGNVPIYNAFLMPYNRAENPFKVSEDYFLNVGEATGEWKNNKKSYEHVQGILIDIRFLMNNYTGSHKGIIKTLAKAIDSELVKTNGVSSEIS